MSMPTLKDLSQMADKLKALERQAQQATERASTLRACNGKAHIGEWYFARVHDSYYRNDYDGFTKLLADALIEFSPVILETLARRQELAAHEAMTAAVMKRAELATFVQIEASAS